MQLQPGKRLRSQVCETELIVIKAPAQDTDLRCGGESVVALEPQVVVSGAPSVPHDAGTLMGKRYAVDDLEVLCTKPGKGSLSIGDTPLPTKEARPLPSSD